MALRAYQVERVNSENKEIMRSKEIGLAAVEMSDLWMRLRTRLSIIRLA